MENTLVQKAERWIEEHRRELVRDIISLVNIRSVSSPGSPGGPYGQGCRDALDEMFRIGRELGFQTREYDGRCGALWLREANETVALWGHLDVVPEGDNWLRCPPFDAVEREGFLYGRGVADNKGPSVAALYVIKALEEAGAHLKRSVKLYVGLNEELGMEDLDHFRRHYPCPDLSIVADTHFPVCYAEKGILEASFVSEPVGEGLLQELDGGIASNVVPDRAQARLRGGQALARRLREAAPSLTVREEAGGVVVEAVGITGHVADPAGSVNAVFLLTGALADSGLLPEEETRILRFFTQVNQDCWGTGAGIPREDELSGKLTCVGSRVFQEEGRLRLHMNIRYPVTVDSQDLLRCMEETGAAHGCSLQTESDSAPNCFPRDHPLVDALTDVSNRVIGVSAAPFVMGGGTYARMLPNAFAFGPELPNPKRPADLPQAHGGAHEPDECICVEELLLAMKVYLRCLLALEEMELPVAQARHTQLGSNPQQV